MIQHQFQEADTSESWLIDLVSERLKVSSSHIDVNAPLVRYGLDSLAAIDLTTAIATELHCDVPEGLLLEYPSIYSLQRYIASTQTGSRNRYAAEYHVTSDWGAMLADSVLPADIDSKYSTTSPASCEAILLTGATGFLGSYLLRALLRDTSAQIYCVVRPHKEVSLRERVRRNLAIYGDAGCADDTRLRMVAGNLLRPRLGMSQEDWDFLSTRINAIYHCGAEVNWIFQYSALRDVNVQATVELLRMACQQRLKRFHFISSIATCYSTLGPAVVREAEDTFANLRGIHLGYAQSKCVAEKLVRQASERGIPAAIYRPGLIIGDRDCGASNSDDLMATMMNGCIRMRSAPDLDWMLDCCPVDYVADAISALSHPISDRLRVFNLTSSTKRNWREIVLWLNLYGYPMKLCDYDEWLEQLERDSIAADHPLHRLKSFFLSRPLAGDGLTLPQLYVARSRNRTAADATRNALAENRISPPELNIQLIDRCVCWLVGRGALPAIHTEKNPRCEDPLTNELWQQILAGHYSDPRLRVHHVAAASESWGSSITAELVSWRYGVAAGLAKYEVTFERGRSNRIERLELFVKSKATDQQVLDVAHSLASVCDERVGTSFARCQDRLGISRCHQRELAIYAQDDPRFRRHVPVVYGQVSDQQRETWLLVLECLTNMELMDCVTNIDCWTPRHIEQVLSGIAEVHSIWHGRETELQSMPWLAPVQSAADAAEMSDLWAALSSFSARYFDEWLDAKVRFQRDEWIETVGEWWEDFDRMPRTLIHNDFNPRNIALRRDRNSLRLCAYDWELAGLGPAQHDLAELLCFVLTPQASSLEVQRYVEFHRRALEFATNQPLDSRQWLHGFQLSLRDLIMNRFPFYCLIHTFRPQPFLERVIRTWQRLNEVVC